MNHERQISKSLYNRVDKQLNSNRMENLEEFSVETLNEMEMGSLIGGSEPDKVPNNCYQGNCAEGCSH